MAGNEIVIGHLTRRTAARYHSRDNTVPVLLCAHVVNWIAGRVFNLDDIGAEIAHKGGDERAGEESCAIDYAQTFQGPRGVEEEALRGVIELARQSGQSGAPGRSTDRQTGDPPR